MRKKIEWWAFFSVYPVGSILLWIEIAHYATVGASAIGMGIFLNSILLITWYLTVWCFRPWRNK